MNKEEFRILVNKYLSGAATAEETRAVEYYYQLFQDEPDVTGQLDKEYLSSLENRMKNRIWQRLEAKEKTPVTFLSAWYFKAAAVFIGLTALMGGLYFLRGNFSSKDQSVAVAAGQANNANRFITLPDGSTVLLHGKSTLTYSKDFNLNRREVTLSGEAYFDVVHLASGEGGDKPFVIKTGNVKTTVLGTAFNIQAWEGQKEVVVTVNRGKVKVENDQKLLAILTENKQIVFNTDTQLSGAKIVEANKTVAWAQTDMTFDARPFGELAEQLGKRYGVKIGFKNPLLKQCTITGRFSGTETIEEVFRILSATSNTTYTFNGDELLIDGEKCH
ncbi:hypothetical protein DYBT9275_04213 [Dyadobacter sp. CECT 9275]|uniref:FecR family protein n=1 Tax=Dyadobacter helix TaxID=2822344 RepID=A0A916N639_9BACT|nr:FecR domain-containing protein [Dyadobacter sp. CECT 9275]CAG5008188.1 hypothetical protein DYBT9275_04213 [Dyadobacter sp. CECT 9275]